MSQADKAITGTADGGTQSTQDGNTQPADEGIPILELKATSKGGTTPSDVAGSLKIPLEAGAVGVPTIQLSHAEDIVVGAGLKIEPRWQVIVSVRVDNLPKETTIKGKAYQAYLCINALLSFDANDDSSATEANKILQTIQEDIKPDRTEEARDKIKTFVVNMQRKYLRFSRLSARDITPGEWLLPIIAGESRSVGGAEVKDKLLAYVRVKIEDQTDIASASETDKKGSNS